MDFIIDVQMVVWEEDGSKYFVAKREFAGVVFIGSGDTPIQAALDLLKQLERLEQDSIGSSG